MDADLPNGLVGVQRPCGRRRSFDRDGQAALSKLEQRIRSGELPGVHGVVVVQHGKTLAEWYFDGEDQTIGQPPLGIVKFGPETLHDIRSVTKSVVSMLFGIAFSEGAIKDLDTPVLDYFPEYADLHTPDRMKITLKDVLSMTSGLHWDEMTYPYTDPRNSEIAMATAEDRYRYALSQPIDAPPGQRWAYSGGDVELIGAVIARATKTPLETYAQQKIFGPMAMNHAWFKYKDIPAAASGLRLTPRDMAKLGVMMLNKGRWQDRQIVPERWVDAVDDAPRADRARSPMRPRRMATSGGWVPAARVRRQRRGLPVSATAGNASGSCRRAISSS